MGEGVGMGELLCFFFELCESIWGGSPATEELTSGVESNVGPQAPSQNASGSVNQHICAENSIGTSDEEDDNQKAAASTSGRLAASANDRRQLLHEKLRNYRQEKLKRKVSVDSQLLALAQDDLAMKRKFMQLMDERDTAHKKKRWIV